MTFTWPKFKWLSSVFEPVTPDQGLERSRIRFIERNVGIPVRCAYLFILLYFLFFEFSDADVADTGDLSVEALLSLRSFFLIYLVINIAVGFLLWGMNQFSLRLIQYLVFTVSLLDVVFLAALTVIDDGFSSNLYWLFPGLIIRNAASVPNVGFQILLNLFVCLCYLFAGVLDLTVKQFNALNPDEYSPESFLLKVMVLLLLAVCCYGLQLLLEKQERAQAEAQEFALRQHQLKASGRLAAEVAHQLKNPLSIINNASYTLQKHLNNENSLLKEQVRIIRDEVEKSDWILTELMGYSKLIEGRVERLNVIEEMEHAIREVFPEGTVTGIKIHRNFSPALPVLLVQRSHLEEVLVNLLKNAREAMKDRGNIWVSIQYGEGYSVIFKIRDDGPGIALEHQEKIFEAYFSTKEHGTGLGMPIVKNCVEMYGGKIEFQSSLGSGTEFTIRFPARTALAISK